MRVMARISIPVESGNAGIQSGALPKTIEAFAERWHPEAMYFTATGGRRTAYLVFDMPDSSSLPEFAEPFFMGLNAEIEVAPAMTGEDLAAGLARLG
ncbi:MAG TPA: DUF3303 family protein [Acidimicrobiales bacterium]|nr:DUF3303 family protein [Acidimicrobiales bacterium]